MAQEENCINVEISDVIEDAELETESTEVECESETTVQDTEVNLELNHAEDAASEEKKIQLIRSEIIRNTRLPISRIKNIMKTDPDVNMINGDAAFLVTKATELFLETLAKETYSYTATKKRKTIAKKDLDTTISIVDCLCFLEGALDF